MGISLLATIAVLGLVGCQQDNRRLDEISKDIKEMKADLAGLKTAGLGPGAARGQAQRPPARQRPPGPDPSKVYAVPIAGDPSSGPANAKVTIVKGFEFACPYCEKVRPTLAQLEKDYGDDIKVVYKHYLVHPQVATIPARASCAAGKQGKFKQMYDLIWEQGFKAGRDLSQQKMDALAAELALDMGKFKADMTGECAQLVQKDHAELAQVGARGTPGFWINGRFLSGARPIQQFKVLIDEELKKANERIAKGTPVEKYYDQWVLAKGDKKLARKDP